jgi:predicted MFS family arabinose efflux permease
MRMWLSKPIYELLPYFYMGTGLAALAASMYLNYWYWPTICLLAGVGLLTGGLVIWLKRRDFRQERRMPDRGDAD